jgi:hypothetical protein
VLLLGPLYHLADRADRVRALTEARRAVRLGGLVAAATITRYSSIHDAIYQGFYLDDGFRKAAHAAASDGTMLSPRSGFTAYFHDPAEVVDEFTDAGLTGAGQYGLQGAFWLYGDVNEWLDDPERRSLILDAQRAMERDPSLFGVSGHLLTIARRVS